MGGAVEGGGGKVDAHKAVTLPERALRLVNLHEVLGEVTGGKPRLDETTDVGCRLEARAEALIEVAKDIGDIAIQGGVRGEGGLLGAGDADQAGNPGAVAAGELLRAEEPSRRVPEFLECGHAFIVRRNPGRWTSFCRRPRLK